MKKVITSMVVVTELEDDDAVLTKEELQTYINSQGLAIHNGEAERIVVTHNKVVEYGN